MSTHIKPTEHFLAAQIKLVALAVETLGPRSSQTKKLCKELSTRLVHATASPTTAKSEDKSYRLRRWCRSRRCQLWRLLLLPFIPILALIVQTTLSLRNSVTNGREVADVEEQPRVSPSELTPRRPVDFDRRGLGGRGSDALALDMGNLNSAK
ncbi:hypothetical protein MSG28_010444 [Choristoneura fumiferana]|uniref:Uncharacterized protein n=1 Tax=Choristoneura fumiferana TaxID=7141 RepID=A0ACC0KKP6_CHOFU|nr:hypothetical protein MSG28_010444 [Choristoneura fumiferana]